MPEPKLERIDGDGPVPLDDIDRYLGSNIEHKKARVANTVTLLLVAGLLAAPVLFVLALWFVPSLSAELRSFFDSWLAILGPVLGAAVGFYFGERRAHPTAEPNARRRRR